MPTYQYACTECGHGFEAVQSFTDDALTECSECSGRLRKIFSSVGIVFKGSGFYRNDSREAVKTATTDKGEKDKSDKADKSDKSSADKGSADKGSETKKSDSPGSDKTTKTPKTSDSSGSTGPKSPASGKSSQGTAA